MPNGNEAAPQYGVCRYHHELRGDVRHTRERVDQIHTGLFGNPENADDEGLRGRVNRHERILKNLSRLFWSLLGIVGTAAGAIGAALGATLWR